MSRLCIAYLYSFLILSSYQEISLAQTQEQRMVEASHGTVNVLLGNGRDLVLATDSRLTFNNGHHTDDGIKLFKLDDRTVCSMAGSYSAPGAYGLIGFALEVPQIIGELAADQFQNSAIPRSFAMKVELLSSRLQHRLTSQIQASVAVSYNYDLSEANLRNSLIELTIAGYDEDGTIKVGEITLVPASTSTGVQFIATQRPHAGPTPICELTASPVVGKKGEGLNISKVGRALFCDVAGLDGVANSILNRGSQPKNDASLRPYAEAKESGRPLSVSELRSLANTLIDETTKDEIQNHYARVGGPTQIAVFSDGKMIEEPVPLPNFKSGRALSGNQFTGFEHTCDPPMMGEPFSVQGNMIHEMQADIKSCFQELDHVIFHDSAFTDSELYYAGKSVIIFADTNKINNTSLTLGPDVNPERPDVHHLVCGFPWSSVSQNQKIFTPTCQNATKRKAP